jgi:hypothetical protein
MTRKIAVLVGSLRKDSFSRKIARNIEALAPAGYTFEEVDISSVGFYNQDLDGNEPAEWLDLRAKIKSARRRPVRDAGIQPLGARAFSRTPSTSPRARMAQRLQRQSLLRSCRTRRAISAALARTITCARRWPS